MSQATSTNGARDHSDVVALDDADAGHEDDLEPGCVRLVSIVTSTDEERAQVLGGHGPPGT